MVHMRERHKVAAKNSIDLTLIYHVREFTVPPVQWVERFGNKESTILGWKIEISQQHAEKSLNERVSLFSRH